MKTCKKECLERIDNFKEEIDGIMSKLKEKIRKHFDEIVESLKDKIKCTEQ